MTNRQALRNCWKFCYCMYLYGDPAPQIAINSMVDHMTKLDAEAIRQWAEQRLEVIEGRLIKLFGYNKDSARDVVNNLNVELDRLPEANEILKRHIMARKAAYDKVRVSSECC